MAETIRDVQKRLRKHLKKKRVEYPAGLFRLWKDTVRQRLDTTRELVEFRGVLGDFHSHTVHSDGIGTVGDMEEMMRLSGLDFIFITDHMGITQKRDCVRYENVWWGQEPGTQYHHLGILGLEKGYHVTGDLLSDWNYVIEHGGLPFIPHPSGWFPTKQYTDEQKAALGLLGNEFTIEVVNGANQVFDAFDTYDAQTIELWDEHLKRGARVTAMGNSDAHLPEGVGSIWTGVYYEEFSREGIIDAARHGRTFASDGPIVDLALQADGGPVRGVGETLVTDDRAVTVRVLAADSLGLRDVNLIRDGEVMKRWRPDGAQVVSQAIADAEPTIPGYYRLECFAQDGRRAYTTPVYLRPAGA